MLNSINKFAGIVLTACMLALVVTGAPLETTTAGGEQEQPQTIQYSSMNNYCYQLDEAFVDSPDSFEAWIKLPQGSIGGTIMGNLNLGGTKYGGVVAWLIDSLGRVKLYWDDGKFQHTFSNEPLDDNTWHHVAVVRDTTQKSFTLYIDGEMVDSVTCVTNDATNAHLSMRVGVAYENYNWTKKPFEGYIRQVTVYTGAISQERIVSDMQNTTITDSLDGRLLGNWCFGDVWSERNISETSGNGNDATLCTFDKYVGVASEDFKYDYSLVILGDVQTTVDFKSDRYNKMIQWIADNADDKKIECVIQLGDLTNSGTYSSWEANERQYKIAADGLSVLDNKVPYCFAPGNHDYDLVDGGNFEQVLYNTYFPYSKHSQLPGFAGAYAEGDMANTYYTFEACGVKYLVINLEYEPRMPIIRWAGRLCEMYPQHRVIVNTHSYMLNDGSIKTTSSLNAKNGVSTAPIELYEGLIKRYENIFMVLCGHVANDDILVRYDTGVHGNTITSLMVNPQGTVYDSGWGEDLAFIMNFNEKAGTINCYYYSVNYDAVWNLQNQFRLEIN